MAWSRLPLLPVVEGLRLLGAVGAQTQRIVGGAWAVIGGWAESGPGDPDSLADDELESEPEVGPAPESEAVPAVEAAPDEPPPADDVTPAEEGATFESVSVPAGQAPPPADETVVTPFPAAPRRRYRAGWPPPPPVRPSGPGPGPGFRGVPVRPVPSRVVAEGAPAGSPAPEARSGAEDQPLAPAPPSPAPGELEAEGAPVPPTELIELTRRVQRVVLGAERFRDEIAREAREMATVILDDAGAEAQRILERAGAQREEELRLAREQATRLIDEGQAERESLIARARAEVAAMIAEGEDELRRRGERIAELTGQITEMLERTTRRRESS